VVRVADGRNSQGGTSRSRKGCEGLITATASDVSLKDAVVSEAPDLEGLDLGFFLGGNDTDDFTISGFCLGEAGFLLFFGDGVTGTAAEVAVLGSDIMDKTTAGGGSSRANRGDFLMLVPIIFGTSND
jgi:hypothetical protein